MANNLSNAYLIFDYYFAVNCVRLVAYISQHGLHGEIYFTQQKNGLVEIESSLETTLQYPDQIWNWGIHQLPTDYSEVNANSRCHFNNLGKQILSFDENLGYLILPGNESSKWNAAVELTGEYTYNTCFSSFF